MTDLAELSAPETKGTDSPRILQVQVIHDLICPWCFIAKRSLDKAQPHLRWAGIDVQVEWLPYQLNPDMPLSGMDRREFRTQRFGWSTSQRMDERAVASGKEVGAHFEYSKQSRTPNTLAAHALLRQAYEEGGNAAQARLVDALYIAYFSKGQDIGDVATLATIAQESGLEDGAVERSSKQRGYVLNQGLQNHHLAPNGVPTYLANGKVLFSGATSFDTYLQIFSDALKHAT